MATTVTNDELSAQARLIWRASFLSSLLRSVSVLLRPDSPSPSRTPLLFLRYSLVVPVAVHPLVLVPTFSAGLPSPWPNFSCPSPVSKHGINTTHPRTFLRVISMIGESSTGTLPTRSLILRVSGAVGFAQDYWNPRNRLLRSEKLPGKVVCSIDEEFLAIEWKVGTFRIH